LQTISEVNAKDLRDVFHLMAVLKADAAGTVASTATAAQRSYKHYENTRVTAVAVATAMAAWHVFAI
jgi:hypothetical protein